MTFYLLPFVCLGLYAALKYGLLPTLEKAQPVSISNRILKEVAVSSVQALNSLVLLAGIVYALLGTLFLSIRLLAGVGSAGLDKRLLGVFDSVNGALKTVSDNPAYEYLVVGVLLLAFGVTLYRTYKKQYSDQFDQKAAELAEGFSSGKLAYTELPPTADMQTIEEKIQAFNDYRNELAETYRQTPSTELAEQIQKVDDLLQVYGQAWYRFDIFRRVKLDNTTTRNTSLKDDVLVFLSSQGWINTVTGLTGTLSKVALVCTMVSLITVQTLQGSRTMADQLGETYLTKKLDEARSSFEKTMAQNTGSRTVTADDEVVLDEMAADYELLFANSLFEKPSAKADSAKERENFKMRSLVVRQQILDAFVQMAANRSNSPDFGTQSDLGDSARYDLSTPEGQTNWRFIRAYTQIESATQPAAGRLGATGQSLQRVQKASTEGFSARTSQGVTEETFRRGPKTAAGRDFRARMRNDFASKSEVLWARAKRNFATYKASFHEPVTLNDLRGRLFTEVVGKIADKSIDMDVTSEKAINELMKEFVDNVRGDVLEKAHTKLSYEFMDMMARGETYGDVIKQFTDLTPGEVVGGNHQAAIMRAEMPTVPTGAADAIAGHHPPSLKPNVKPVDLTEAEQALKNMNGGTVSERSTAALNTYEDFFPGQMGSESGTSAGQLRRSVASAEVATAETASERLALSSADDAVRAVGEVAGNALGEVGSALSKAEASFIRSRSYVRLRGFSRIGGVLIGNDPENKTASPQETKADFVDLTWQEAGDKLTLSLRNRDNTVVQVGTYPKSIVQQALAYAADGRLTTVTMVSVPPVSQLKVLLHPSLVNSQLGLTAMDLDRLVDSFQSPQIGEARERVTIWGVLYSTAYLERSLAPVSIQNLPEDEQQQIERLRRSQEAKWKSLAGYWSLLRSVTPEDNPNNYPFKEKAAYFDMDLLQTIQRVMKSSANFEAFRQNLVNTFGTESGHGRSSFGSEFEVWSGVREQKYSVDKTLSFLQNNTHNPYYPLDFMVQVAFTSITQPKADDSEAEEEQIVDTNPWQFPALTATNAVNQAVMRGIYVKPQYQQVLRDMQQFTQLQRVFRLAFRGQLGYDFPLDELLNVLAATNGSVPRTETPEWNMNPNAYIADLTYSRESADFASLVRALGVYRRKNEREN